jgi:DNA repair exonuclease SbcCD ATPase subunit
MEENGRTPEERQIIKIEEMSLEEMQLAEQLYNSAGLDPVVEAGLKDYDKRLQQENKLLSKVLGPRGSDIKGYGETVAKRVALAVYALLNKQYGGKVGDLRSYIMALQEERDRANARYDDLMGRVVGILGEEYKELRTDSKAFMEKLATVLGEDLKESRIDQKALAERLADIDGLREQIKTLEKEKTQLEERHESRIAALTGQHSKELDNLRAAITELESKIKALQLEKAMLTDDIARLREDNSQLSEQIGKLRAQIADLEAKISGLEAEKTALTGDLAQLRENHDQLKTAITALAGAIPDKEIGKRLGEELYSFLLKDSKVPHIVIESVGKFIDFRKYLGLAAERGSQEAGKRAQERLSGVLQE